MLALSKLRECDFMLQLSLQTSNTLKILVKSANVIDSKELKASFCLEKRYSRS